MRVKYYLLKRTIGILLISSMILGLTACKEQEEVATSSIKIGVSVYDKYDTFVAELMECVKEEANKVEKSTGIKINISVSNAGQDQASQNEQVENMINNGCDVICVNLVDRTEPTTIIDLGKENNVPIIFFNRELVEEDLDRWDKLYYVGAVADESGVLEGEIAAEAFRNVDGADKNNDGIFQYIMLEGEPGHQDAIVRTESSVQAIVKAGIEVERLDSGIANWNRAQAQSKMNQFISQYGNEIELVIANNDDMALGAVDALEDLGVERDKWPVIVGIDGTSVGLEAVNTGKIYGTVYNNKEGQAEALINLSYYIAMKKDLSEIKLLKERYIRLPYEKIGADGN